MRIPWSARTPRSKAPPASLFSESPIVQKECQLYQMRVGCVKMRVKGWRVWPLIEQRDAKSCRAMGWNLLPAIARGCPATHTATLAPVLSPLPLGGGSQTAVLEVMEPADSKATATLSPCGSPNNKKESFKGFFLLLLGMPHWDGKPKKPLKAISC